MGSAIAERLLVADHEVSVWNRSKGKADESRRRRRASSCKLRMTPGQARMSASPWSPTPLHCHDLALSVRRRPRSCRPGSGRTLIDMSTISVQSSSDVAAAADASGVAVSARSGERQPRRRACWATSRSSPRVRRGLQVDGGLLLDIGPQVFYAGEGRGCARHQAGPEPHGGRARRSSSPSAWHCRSARRTTRDAAGDRRCLCRRLAPGEVQDPGPARERLRVDLHAHG